MDDHSGEALRHVGHRLALLRAQHGQAIGHAGLPPAEFAALLHIEPILYEACESGRTDPPVVLLAALHRRTGVSLDWLIAGAQEAE